MHKNDMQMTYVAGSFFAPSASSNQSKNSIYCKTLGQEASS
jgi:hypothetical protein